MIAFIASEITFSLVKMLAIIHLDDHCKRQVLFPKKWQLFFLKCGKLFSRIYSSYGGWVGLFCPFRFAPVKGLSRHNGAPAPLFHDPLDSLAFLRSGIVPITGSQTYPKVSRYRHFIVRRKADPLLFWLSVGLCGALPLHPGLLQRARRTMPEQGIFSLYAW